ncbi:MAG: nuclear transport factor 2 family protein [Ketobacteraceae bacterium]|nr:nuclear transport factor 2 family protein [Ketobacteraceae bacterium]
MPQQPAGLIPITTLCLKLLVCYLILPGCSQSPDEEVIKANVEALAEAIESKQTDTAVDFFHDNFVTDKGQDKEWIQRTMLLHTIRHDTIQLLLTNISVELLDEATARASFHVIATGGRGLIPEQGQAYRMETEWRKEGSDWALVFAKWKKALDAQSQTEPVTAQRKQLPV